MTGTPRRLKILMASSSCDVDGRWKNATSVRSAVDAENSDTVWIRRSRFVFLRAPKGPVARYHAVASCRFGMWDVMV
jgi:hypothetical protein